jgi:hypothetical protein
VTEVLAEPDELLSPHEKAPRPPKETAPRDSELPHVSCQHCEERFHGPWRQARLAAHVKKRHPEHWSGPAGKRKAPPRKAAGARKAPAKPTRTVKDVVLPPAGPKRRPAADSLARMATRAGKMVGSIEPEFANALVFSAPAMGVSADEALADTFVDRRVIQPLTRASDRWTKLSDAFSLPAMVLIVSKRPELFPVLEDELREAVEGVLIAQVPIMERRVARRQKVTAALARLGELDPAVAASEDPIGDILRGLFTVPEREETPEPGTDGP